MPTPGHFDFRGFLIKCDSLLIPISRQDLSMPGLKPPFVPFSFRKKARTFILRHECECHPIRRLSYTCSGYLLPNCCEQLTFISYLTAMALSVPQILSFCISPWTLEGVGGDGHRVT